MECLAVPVYTSRRTRELDCSVAGSTRHRRSTRSLVYAPEIERCFLLLQQIFDGRFRWFSCDWRRVSTVSMPGINWASDFDFDATMN